jgi:hypothetical protein
MIWNQCTTDLVLVNEYRCGYAASFCDVLIFLVFQSNKNDNARSITFTNSGGYKIDCHNGALLRIDRRPKRRNKTWGDALTRALTMPFDRPVGDMAGARAMNTFTWLLSFGWTARLAKAWAVPWEKPM